MDHFDAPATLLVATHCAFCNLPLVEPDSVQTGVGPKCRKKHGYDVANHTPDWDRVKRLLRRSGYGFPEVGFTIEEMQADPKPVVNKLVYRIAADHDGTVENVNLLTALVDAIGYTQMARQIAKRVARILVTVSSEDGALAVKVKVPFGDPAWAPIQRSVEAIPGWSKTGRVQTVPQDQAATLWDNLRGSMPQGSLVQGGKFLSLI